MQRERHAGSPARQGAGQGRAPHQHYQGRNPADFDCRFDLVYGKEYFEDDAFLRELRAMLDEETAARLHGTP